MSTLERLALRVLLPGFAGTTLPDPYAALLTEGLGGICLFGSNTSGDVGGLTKAIGAAGEHPVIAIDEEGGDVTRLHALTGSPALGPAALGVVDDLALTSATGASIGAELAALGINLDLAPSADVNTDPDNPVIGVRSFGVDPYDAARHVSAWVTGLQSAGVSACVKHFPGHGDTSQDSHLALPVVDVPAEVLATRELVPFRAAVATGVDAVMTSHLVVPALDDRPATLSDPVLRVLREHLGFTGAIVSDALDMKGASADRGIPRAAVEALVAGCDLLCLGPGIPPALVQEVRDAIVAAVSSGELPLHRLEEAADRVDRLGSRAPGTPVASADQHAGARLALRLDGDLPSLADARVVRVETVPNIAVGAVPWGLPGESVAPASLASLAEEERTVVLQVREAHRRPAVRALLSARTGPTLLVEWGWPGPSLGVPRLCSYGASLPARDAVAEVLRAHGWTEAVS